MSVMAIGKTDLGPAPLTVDDLRRTPDDGRRYELVDGRLDVSPAPVFLHSRVETRLSIHLGNLAPVECEIITGPGININADRTHHRIPDLVVISTEDAESPYLTKPPLLAVEVVSPESVLRDHHTKKHEYAAFGIPSYWVITPDPDEPSIIEMRLKDGEYTEVAAAFGEDVLDTELPFPMRVVPQWLLRSGGDWRRHIGGPEEADDAKATEEAEKSESGA
ncbi:Uma2 family endonuclease [Nocardiopsis ganjiahuensis]|uniref:Uma2 family endonuclease n=1 Tax=Nocardiopsis ganjiahuensis TaxID=239984 RepID=UPI000346649F|nr:Uma2 family endonuclease [Nocardiopsis ganjiahuensis]